MQALIGPRVHKDMDFIPSSAQTYEKVRRLFSGLVRDRLSSSSLKAPSAETECGSREPRTQRS